MRNILNTKGGPDMTSEHPDQEREEMIAEYERLLKCYQLASRDDRNVIWAVLNKYAPKIDIICD